MVLTLVLFLAIVVSTISGAELVRGKCTRMLTTPVQRGRAARR